MNGHFRVTFELVSKILKRVYFQTNVLLLENREQELARAHFPSIAWWSSQIFSKQIPV